MSDNIIIGNKVRSGRWVRAARADRKVLRFL